METSMNYLPRRPALTVAFVPSLVLRPFFGCVGKGLGTMLFPLHF